MRDELKERYRKMYEKNKDVIKERMLNELNWTISKCNETLRMLSKPSHSWNILSEDNIYALLSTDPSSVKYWLKEIKNNPNYLKNYFVGYCGNSEYFLKHIHKKGVIDGISKNGIWIHGIKSDIKKRRESFIGKDRKEYCPKIYIKMSDETMKNSEKIDDFFDHISKHIDNPKISEYKQTISLTTIFAGQMV